MSTIACDPVHPVNPGKEPHSTRETDYPIYLARRDGVGKFPVSVGPALEYRERPGKRMHPYVASTRFEAARMFGQRHCRIEQLGPIGASLLDLTEAQLEAWEQLAAYHLEVFYWQLKAAGSTLKHLESRLPIGHWDQTPLGRVIDEYRQLVLQFREWICHEGLPYDGRRRKVPSIIDIVRDLRDAIASEGLSQERPNPASTEAARALGIGCGVCCDLAPGFIPRPVSVGDALKNPAWRGKRMHPYVASPWFEAKLCFGSCCDQIEELGPPGARTEDLTDQQVEAWEQLAAYHLEMFYWQLEAAGSTLESLNQRLPDPCAWLETPWGKVRRQYWQLVLQFKEWIIEDGNPYEDSRKRVRSIVQIVREARRNRGGPKRTAGVGKTNEGKAGR